LEICGNHWTSVGICENRWKSVASCRIQWKSVENLWDFLEISGNH